jgi:RNA polymerase subunit RPABC4/transcription elongation factor Spt4
MGSIVHATCACGFNDVVIVGAGRMNYRTESKFPFYCKACGLVSVNITTKELKCPDCHSKEVQPYGRKPISNPKKNNDYLQWGPQYGAAASGHLCPACKKKTMSFQMAGLFD